MRPAGAYSCESEVAAATRWNRVALASSVSLVKLVSVRPSGGVDILDKAGAGPEDVPEGQATHKWEKGLSIAHPVLRAAPHSTRRRLPCGSPAAPSPYTRVPHLPLCLYRYSLLLTGPLPGGI